MNGEKHILGIKERDMLDVLLNVADEAFVFVDKSGTVQAMSRAYMDFLGKSEEECLHQHVTEVIENSCMHVVLETGKAEYAQIQKLRGENMVATRLPIYQNGEVIGAFGRVLFKNVKEVRELSKKIDKMELELNLYKKDFQMANQAKYGLDDIVSTNREMLTLKKTVKKISNMKSNVLILGESGTGKELVAHSIHRLSARAENPFVSVNCGAIPAELLETELFGYEEGAFTGARKGGQIGYFNAADTGTIFLDEIGELSLNLQVKLLRVLQDHMIVKVGSTTPTKVDIRIIAATNRNLQTLVEMGKFRADLYFRLNVVTISLPPLRKRLDDLPLLSAHIVKKVCKKEQLKPGKVSLEALHLFYQYDWPGNIRELENVIESAINCVEEGGSIKIHHLPQWLTGVAKREQEREALKTVMDNFEKEYITQVLVSVHNNKTKASKILGLSRTSLYEKLEKHHITL